MGKSARKRQRLPKSTDQDPPPINLSTDDEADDDLSLKIVQKAMLRASGNQTTATTNGPSPSVGEVKKKRKKKNKEKMVAQIDVVEDVETKEDDFLPINTDAVPEIKEDGGPLIDTDAATETEPSEKADNVVLRKLLRGPRYFDPPDNNWGNCYNCGEGGHSAANCTSAKRKKPCFVCGSFEHNVKQCTKGKDCFICKKGGHRAKDCPERSVFGSQVSKICLKCGVSGHEMFTCKNKYSSDDLKEIQCYVCKAFGHLCCVNPTGEGPKEVSCYRCGQLGHSGWECARFYAETTSNGTPSSCYKCGQDGHLARKCTSTPKKEKKSESSSSSLKKKHSKGKNGSHLGARSVPHDLGNARKRNKTQNGQASSSHSKPRGRGGWITEDPDDYGNNYNHNHHNHHNNGYGSPKTPVRYRSSERSYGSGYRSSNDRFHVGSGYNQGYNSPVASNGYQHQQRFSASRFGNSSNYGKRDYSWDY